MIITTELILSMITSIFFLGSLTLSYYIYRHHEQESRDIWFFFGLSTTFALFLSLTQMLCIGVTCMAPAYQHEILRVISDPGSQRIVESSMVILASAFSFTALYLIWSTLDEK